MCTPGNDGQEKGFAGQSGMILANGRHETFGVIALMDRAQVVKVEKRPRGQQMGPKESVEDGRDQRICATLALQEANGKVSATLADGEAQTGMSVSALKGYRLLAGLS